MDRDAVTRSLARNLKGDLNALGYCLATCRLLRIRHTGRLAGDTFGGVQPDQYGKIEDMIVASETVSPAGTMKPLTPKSSAPDLDQHRRL
jgi:hypothetical protein